MPTYTGPGLLAGPYWDAFEPDPANAFSPDNEASQGVLGTLPAWAAPMMPAQPRTDFLPWPGLMPIDQAPNDFGPLLPPGLRKPPWWFRPAPSMPPLLPPWAYPPPDVPRLPPLMPDYRPEPLPQLRVDDPLEMVRFGAAFSPQPDLVVNDRFRIWEETPADRNARRIKAVQRDRRNVGRRRPFGAGQQRLF